MEDDTRSLSSSASSPHKDKKKVANSHGNTSEDATLWNKVKVHGSTYTVERAPALLAKISLDTIDISYVSEKKESKRQCALCRGYYSKASLVFKVPNHRILELQKKWNYTREGRRYESASFLYATVNCCVFCSQMFQDVEDIDHHHLSNSSSYRNTATTIGGSSILLADGSSILLADGSSCILFNGTNGTNGTNNLLNGSSGSSSSSMIKGASSHDNDDSIMMMNNSIVEDSIIKKSTITRKNIADNQKTYQSSEVDSYISSNAITTTPNNVSSSSTLYSKTRREVDPWWEIDWGKRVHIHSLSFFITNHLPQKMCVSVLLLKTPVGFEDPFLDSVIRKSVVWKEFSIPACYSSVENVEAPVEWHLPDDSLCTSIRIQIRGISTLYLSKFIAYLGDMYINPDVDSVTGDTVSNQFKDSFASIAPSRMREGSLQMLSPARRKDIYDRSHGGKSSPVSSYDKNKSINLVNNLKTVIQQKYKLVNEWTEKINMHMGFFTKEEVRYLYRCVFNEIVENSDSSTIYKSFKLSEDDLFTDAITATYPRIQLADAHAAIRLLLRYIQSKSNLKVIGPLMNNECLVSIADDPQLLLQNLMSAFNKVDNYWNDYYANQRKRRKSSSSSSSSSSSGGAYDEYKKGCSWSQFCIIIHLFCSDACDAIPSEAFGISDACIASNANEAKGNSTSVSVTNNNVTVANAINTATTNASSETPAHLLHDMINARGHQQTMSTKNYAFSQYKLSHLVKRTNKHPNFPKKLDSNFSYDDIVVKMKDAAATAAATAAANATSTSIKKSIGTTSSPSLILPLSLTDSNSTSFTNSYSNSRSSDDNNDSGLYKACGLCSYSYPSVSVDQKVLRKHILTIRRMWSTQSLTTVSAATVGGSSDSGGDDDGGVLEQTISQYNLVSICVFCSQYFDPEEVDGIANPIKEIKARTSKSAGASITSQRASSIGELVPFYDQRYPSRNEGELAWRHRLISSRSSARSALHSLNYFTGNNGMNDDDGDIII